MNKTLFIVLGLAALVATANAQNQACAAVGSSAADANCATNECSSTAANVCTAGNCNSGYYFDSTTSVCTVCDSSCSTCDDSGATECTACASTYGADTTPAIGSPQTCTACPTNCDVCDGDTTVCTSCSDSYTLYNSICCPSDCAECSSATVCTSCNSGFTLETSGTCTDSSSGFKLGASLVIIVGLFALMF